MLYEDDYCVVADKPAGITVDGEQGLEAVLCEARGGKAVQAVHRLDKETTGCVLLAKSRRARERFEGVFEKREVYKRYQTIVSGTVRQSEMTIDQALDGRKAVTSLSVRSAGRDASHCFAVIRTGRTHQIRRHLAGVGHPVLGDTRYGLRRVEDSRTVVIPRLMLHADKLELSHPYTGEPIRVKSSLPSDFRGVLKEFNLR